MTRNHIEEEFGRKIHITQYLDRYQNKHMRRAITTRIKEDIQFLNENSKRWPKVKKKEQLGKKRRNHARDSD